MKKLLCLLLAVLLVVTLVSCNSKSTSKSTTEQQQKSEETKPAPIELTTSNIGDYLSFSCNAGEITRTYDGVAYVSGKSILTYTSYPIVPGNFYNVKVSLSLSNIPTGWTGGSITVTIPSNGCLQYSSSIRCGNLTGAYGGGYVYTGFAGSSRGVKVLSVSGTFQPE